MINGVEEAGEERSARVEREWDALKSKAPDSVRSRIERIIAAGGYYDDGDEGHTIDKACLAFAGAATKAVAIALLGANSVTDDHGVDVTFDHDDAARVLCGLSALLTEAYHLSHDISIADGRAVQS